MSELTTSGVTDKLVKYRYTHTIKDYGSLVEMNELKNKISPMFPEKTCGIRFYLEFNITCAYSGSSLSVCLHPVCLKESTKECKFTIGIQSDLDALPLTTKVFKLNQSPTLDIYNIQFLVDDLTGELPNDSLTVHCEILMPKDLVEMCNVVKVPECKLTEDLAALLNSKELNDVTIVTADGYQIPAHKNILSARSKVFAAMFQHPLEETKLGCVILNDFNHDVVNEMLGFMYTGKAPNLESMTEDLLAVAEKYDLGRLKGMCAKDLFEKLSIETAAVTLKLADIYNLKELKSWIAEFINIYFDRVIETPNWKQLMTTDRKLITELFFERKLRESKLSDDVQMNS